MTSRAYQEVLMNAAKTMVRIKNPRRLLKMITRFVVREVGLTHTSILIHEPAKRRYVFVDSKGDKRIPTSLIRLDHTNPLIQWFVEVGPKRSLDPRFKNDYLFYSDVAGWLDEFGENGHDPKLKNKLNNLKKTMSTLNATLCIPGFYKHELLGVMLLGEKHDGEPFTKEEIAFFQTLANDASMTIQTANLKEDLLERNLELELKQKELKEKLTEIEFLRSKEQKTYFQIVWSLAKEVYAKDPYTSGHSAHVEHLGLMTAREMGYDLKDRNKKNALKASLRLHDVGKIGIPDSILKKESSLTEEEWKIMREHPVRGAKILEPLSEFKDVAKIVLHHHERYNGTGYPHGLKGEAIPIESRIISVVDAFHAIVSTRCYRKGRLDEVAIAELKKGAGTQFDPDVVEAFLRAYDRESAQKNGQKKTSESITA